MARKREFQAMDAGDLAVYVEDEIKPVTREQKVLLRLCEYVDELTSEFKDHTHDFDLTDADIRIEGNIETDTPS